MKKALRPLFVFVIVFALLHASQTVGAGGWGELLPRMSPDLLLKRSNHVNLTLHAESPTADANLLETRTGTGSGTVRFSIDEDGDLDANSFEFSSGAWTTTVAEMNQALTSINATVTDTNLNTLTSGGSGDALHTHSSSIPAGVIMIWSGSLASIPAGWALCDGTGGTPNLLDRFVIGVPNNSTDPGTTGGANTYSITSAQMPSHNHGITVDNNGDHSHSTTTNFDGSHDHTGGPEFSQSDSCEGGFSSTNRITTNVNLSGNHDHTVSSVSSTGSHTHTTTVNNTGSGTSVDNRPSYYEIAFIIKQ